MGDRSHTSTLQDRLDAALIRLREVIAAYNAATQFATDIPRICLLARTINSQLESMVRMRCELEMLTESSNMFPISEASAADDEKTNKLVGRHQGHVTGHEKTIQHLNR